MLYPGGLGEDRFWRLVEALAARMCGWCTRECIEEAVEAARGGGEPGECRQAVVDAVAAVEAWLSWSPPPSLGEELRVVYEWAARSLYAASVAELLASRRARRVVAARGLWARRVVERLLHDYWLAGGERILVSEYRAPFGWVAYPRLASCRGGGFESFVGHAGGLRLRVGYRCGGEKFEVVLGPPLAAVLYSRPGGAGAPRA